MIDTASALMIAGAALQAIPAGRAVIFFVKRRSSAPDVGRHTAPLLSMRGTLRSSS